MDILFNLVLAFSIVILFMFLIKSENPYIYGTLIVFSLSGFIITLTDPLYLITGWETTLTYDSLGDVTGSITIPIKESYNIYNYVFELYYLSVFIGSIVYWVIGREKQPNED